MRIENKKRTIGIGIIVGLLFFGWWFNDYLYLNWRFKLFSLDSWRFLRNEFRLGWHLSAKSDWIFFISFIISGPLYLALWYGANRIHWRRSARRLGRTCQKPLKILKKKQAPLYTPVPVHQIKKQASLRPAKLSPGMSSSLRPAMANVAKAPFEMAQQPAWMTPQSQPTPAERNYPTDQPFYPTESGLSEIAETPLSEVQLPQIESVNEDIGALMREKGFHVFTDVPFGEGKLNWLGVSQNQLLVGLYDDETGDWLADEEAFNDEDPLWFSETDHRVSPVFILKQIQKQLQAQAPDLRVQPMLIERRGNLINAEDMMKTWNDLGVIVCRTDVGGPVELATFKESCQEAQPLPSEELLVRVKSIFNLGEINNG